MTTKGDSRRSRGDAHKGAVLSGFCLLSAVASSMALGGCPPFANLDELGTRDASSAISPPADGAAVGELTIDSGPVEAGPFDCHPSGEGMQQVSVRLSEFSTGDPALQSGLGARLCDRDDFPCRAPLPLPGHQAKAELGAGFVGPVAGEVSAEVPAAFSGFFEIAGGPFARTIRQFSGRVPSRMDMVLLRPAELGFLADFAMNRRNAYDAEQFGLVMIFARDCEGKPISRVSFVSETPAGTPFYIVDASPSAAARMTDARGTGGFINVPPGLHKISVVEASGSVIGSFAVRAAPSVFTSVNIFPGER